MAQRTHIIGPVAPHSAAAVLRAHAFKEGLDILRLSRPAIPDFCYFVVDSFEGLLGEIAGADLERLYDEMEPLEEFDPAVAAAA